MNLQDLWNKLKAQFQQQGQAVQDWQQNTAKVQPYVQQGQGALQTLGQNAQTVGTQAQSAIQPYWQKLLNMFGGR